MYKQNLNLRKDELLVARADGDNEPMENSAAVEAAEQTVQAAELLGEMIGGPQRRRAGLRINGTYFPLSDIMLFGILIATVFLACKVAKK